MRAALLDAFRPGESNSGRITIMSRLFTQSQLDRAVAKQEHNCAYCALPFGTVVSYRGRQRVQKPEGDHIIPWAYSGDSLESNLVASCDICNHFKSSHVFADKETAWRHIARRRNESHVLVEFVPVQALTADPVVWGEEYARFLSS